MILSCVRMFVSDLVRIYLSREMEFVFCSDLVGLRKSIMVDDLGLLVSIATKKRLALVTSDDVYHLHYFLLDFVFVVFFRYDWLNIAVVCWLSCLSLLIGWLLTQGLVICFWSSLLHSKELYISTELTKYHSFLWFGYCFRTNTCRSARLEHLWCASPLI